MPKAINVPPLNLSNSRNASPQIGTLSARSTDSPKSPRSPPLSPALNGTTTTLDMQIRAENGPASPRLGTSPDAPVPSGRVSPKQHSRDASKSFFSNIMASKSTQKLLAQSDQGSIADISVKSSGRSRGNSKDRSTYSLRKQTSTPDLPRLMTANEQQDDGNNQIPPASADGPMSKQKSKSKLGGILTRSRSGRPEDEKKLKQRPSTQLNFEISPPSEQQSDHYATPLKTAPIKNGFRDHVYPAEGAAMRNRSADQIGNEDPRPNGHSAAAPPPQQREGLFATFQHTGRGVGDRLGKAGRGLFNKMTRSGSTNERELVPDEHYSCTTINLPLVKQTRKTRIAKRLDQSNDKTEYWMPALPWRCIDYLNMQCEQEGLYRVPGSGRDVKFWQRRFDTERDINLFDEPELYDVNTIASMFKAWLRDLPDELFPKATQARISRECHGAQQTPQLLKDELSKLPPFNYYLLFAITCHLSLLHSYADQNKMDYRNLCICFQPCLKIDAFCFQFLVIDWKECWQQGCWTEKDYLAEELRHDREGSIKQHDEPRMVDDRAMSSRSGSSTNLPATRDGPIRKPDSAHGNARGTSPSVIQRPQNQLPQTQMPPPQPVPLKPKQRSLSASGQERTRIPSHGHAQTAPAVPRLIVKTPEQESDDRKQARKLPELGSMSPIRME
ncbi:hypothetical protein LTS08_007464 [Lithohypha guttulata]|nr:hypothetical protein LTS08_007464 [Lithohypha guttulata]